jgi:two-component system NarL family sensor kinase
MADRIHILVVDDDTGVCRLLKRWLERENYEVTTKADPVEALALASTESFDLILADLVMGDIGGLDIISKAKRTFPETVAILITGHPSLDSAIEALRLGAYDYLLKPFELRILLATVERGLQHQRLTRENMQLRQTLSAYATGEAMGSLLEFPSLLQFILDSVRDLVDAQQVSLVLQDRDTEELHIEASRGLPAEATERLYQNKEDNIIGWVMTHREALLLQGQVSDAFFSSTAGDQRIASAICVPLVTQDRTIGALSVTRLEPSSPFAADQLEMVSILADRATVAIENARLYENLQREEKRVEQLLEATINAQEEERERISMEIHDGLTQGLISALHYTHVLQGSLPAVDNSEEVEELIDRLLHILRMSIDEIRHLVKHLHPDTLNDLGLLAALRSLLNEVGKATGWQITFIAPEEQLALPKKVESALYRIVQEALNNVVKHARTERVQVTLEAIDNQISVGIQDWGMGFNPAEVDRGLGLNSMSKRAELLGGALDIDSTPGEGTTIRVKMPLRTGRGDR